MDSETVKPLELLHRIAVDLGAVLVLTATHDDRLPGGGKRIHASQAGAELRSLLIVRPNPDEFMGRWKRLAQGDILATCKLDGTVSLDEIATVMTEAIEEAKQRRSADA